MIYCYIFRNYKNMKSLREENIVEQIISEHERMTN